LDLRLILEIPVAVRVFGNTINSNHEVIFRRNNRCGDRPFIPVGQAAAVLILVITVVVNGAILRVDRDSDHITTTPIITEHSPSHVHRGLGFKGYPIGSSCLAVICCEQGGFFNRNAIRIWELVPQF
jgi:hypothetical protein